ncbi:uncharacterized protein LOC143301874 [Babylonia areolata]|uniref:uncharacterized protein LOC143301874 n=1 Tax=Babylonia areolata TaxID=304850 RepID=UPI003FD27600
MAWSTLYKRPWGVPTRGSIEKYVCGEYRHGEYRQGSTDTGENRHGEVSRSRLIMAAFMSEAAEIRKLRKKLRQIDNLERLTRPLDELEEIKVDKKFDIRERLQELLDRVASGADSQAVDDSTVSVLPPSPSVEREEAEEARDVPQGESEGRGSEEGGAVLTAPSGEEKMKEKVHAKQSLLTAEEPESSPPQASGDRAVEKASKRGRKAGGEKTRSSQWEHITVLVSELDGHHDLVTSISVQGTNLVSASRDTTVKVWDLESGEETCSFGGHTETVTSVLILSAEESALLKEEDTTEGDSCIISGSTDCTFKVWSLKSGKLIRSVYTFNPITCLDYSCSAHLLVTASDGGKVELWDVKTGKNVCSVRDHEDAVTAVKVLNNTVITADAEGLVMVHEIRHGSLVRVFVSEDVKVAGSGQVHRRTIRSLGASDKVVVIGDDAVNLKLLDWKKGVVSKAVNHVSQFASTDAVCLWEDLLLTSTFDLDTGYGYINVRSLSTGEYLVSMDDAEAGGTERIVCLAASRLRSGHCVFVSGGAQLKVWQLLPPGHSVPESEEGEEDKWVTVTQFLPALAKPARDSDAESDLDEDDDEDEEDIDEKRRQGGGQDGEAEASQSWISWCSIV